MSTDKSKPIAYAIERDDYLKLCGIEVALFGDGKTLTPDARRDLANLMHVLLRRVTPLDESDLKGKA